METKTFVALVVVVAIVLLSLVFVMDVFFPTPDPVEYARQHTPAGVSTSSVPQPTSPGGVDGS